ncbi:MAG: hypothetical protein CHACPFDD_03674 [Phycisphaerae bacterium]|nr:hypothetical protein [Phycisphaerae bacterium]
MQRHDLPFPILSDTERHVIRAFGVLHAGGAPNGGDIAIPSHFLIDRDGRIVWRFIATRVQNRPDPAELIGRIRALR